MSDRIDTLHGDLERGVAALVSSDGWQAWLASAARFHHYSLNNQLLIALQCPTATRVAGYRAWQAMGRQVRKGERSIGILAPNTRKVRNENTGEEERRITGYRVASVFDVSQTDGDPLPERPESVLLTGDAPAGLWDALQAVATGNGYIVTREACGTANGITVPNERRISVRPNVSGAQACKTLAHELAHMLLHTGEGFDYAAHRGIAEVEAESVAYIVANAAGIATAPYSLPYIAGWSDGDASLVTATANRVRSTARNILSAVLPDAD